MCVNHYPQPSELVDNVHSTAESTFKIPQPGTSSVLLPVGPATVANVQRFAPGPSALFSGI